MENIKTINGNFYEVVVKHQKTKEDGTETMIKETICTKAYSFSEAEKNTMTGMMPEADLTIQNINPAPYHEIFMSDNAEDECFFKCKVVFLTIDEITEKEKKTKTSYLVQASSTKKAQCYLEKALSDICDYKIESVAKSSVTDIFNLNS